MLSGFVLMSVTATGQVRCCWTRSVNIHYTLRALVLNADLLLILSSLKSDGLIQKKLFV